MSLFEVKPYDREVYEKELKDFLPQKILDVHTHVYLKEFFPPKPLAPGEVKRTVTWPSLVAADDWFELKHTLELFAIVTNNAANEYENMAAHERAAELSEKHANLAKRNRERAEYYKRLMALVESAERLPETKEDAE